MEERPDGITIPGNGAKPTPRVYHPYRCLHCGRLLFEAIIFPGCKVRARCPKCGRMVIVEPNRVTVEEAEDLTLTP